MFVDMEEDYNELRCSKMFILSDSNFPRQKFSFLFQLDQKRWRKQATKGEECFPLSGSQAWVLPHPRQARARRKASVGAKLHWRTHKFKS